MNLKVLLLIAKYGALLTKYAKYLPFIFSFITAAEALISGVRRGEDKKAMVLSLLTTLINNAGEAGFITPEEASAIIETLVELAKAVGAMPKPEPVPVV